MEASVISLKLRLQAETRQDGGQWVARCIPLDVYSQGDTKKRALDSLSEAVQLWFESCIDRGVLDEALEEAGFLKAKADEAIPEDASAVSMGVDASAQVGRVSFIEVTVPAYIAAARLDGVCAPC